MHLRYLVCNLVMFLTFSMSGQSLWFGPKLGPTVSFQQWNNIEQDALFTYHGAFFIETFDEESPSSLYAQLGYHTRGSAIRVNDFFSGFNSSQGFEFNNVALILGAKRKFSTMGSFEAFYTVGIRGEYTVNTNLQEYERFESFFYPMDQFVNKVNYGLSFGGGLEYRLSEFIGGSLELTISPDLSFQYQSPEIGNITNPFTGNVTNVGERQIRNLSAEISLAVRFLRKVIYEDY